MTRKGSEEDGYAKYPLFVRVLIIIGGASVLWGLIITGVIGYYEWVHSLKN